MGLPSRCTSLAQAGAQSCPAPVRPSSSENRKKAQATLELFNREGVVPLITSFHLHELIQYQNDRAVQDRIKFLESLPCVAWLDNIRWPGSLGSILDIHAAEVDVLVQKGVCTFPKMIELVRERLLCFGKGVDITRNYEGSWDTLRAHLQARLVQNREIASISAAQSIYERDKPLTELLRGEFRPVPEARKVKANSKKKLEDELTRRGDKKLENVGAVAQSFTEMIWKNGMSLDQKEGHPVEQILENAGIKRTDLPPKATLDDIGYLAIFKERMKIVGEILKLENEPRLSQIRVEDCPSSLIWYEVQRIRRNAPRACGSDINDAFLACLSCYADFTEVDRRTHDHIRQARQRNGKLREVIRDVYKSANDSDLSSVICPIPEDSRK